MRKRFIFVNLLVFLIAAFAAAQDHPLSAPEHPPIPLSDADQQRAREAEIQKLKPTNKNNPPSANPVSGALFNIHGNHISSGRPYIDSLVIEASASYSLDPCLIISVIQAESGYNSLAVSPKGARGLMQLIPATASRFGVKNLYDPRENVMGGSRYLRWLMDRFKGDVRLALAGYNAGERAVEIYGNRIPPFLETQNYVRTIYAHYSRVHSGPLTPLVEPKLAGIPPAEKIPTYNQIIRYTSSGN